MATDVQVPTLGESITEGTLAQWLKKPGEAVAADEPIASLETDKVSVEVLRVEQLYPFPSEPLVARLKAMPKLQEVVWAQEEPKNNGAWTFVQPLLETCLAEAGHAGIRTQYAGREPGASPATGLAKRHAAQQAALIAAALGHSSRAEPSAVAAQ